MVKSIFRFRPKRRKMKIKKRKSFRNGFFILLFFLAAFGMLTFILFQLDNKIMPAVLAITDLQTKTKVNSIINSSVADIIKKMELSSNDFLKKTNDDNGKIDSLSVNTILVNEICGKVATDISGKLVALDKEIISLPVGALLGIQAFANFGPLYSITVIPMGNALVDYDTSFESVGINQTNFQVWLTVDSTVQVVNPLQRREIAVTRKISLVNTVIHGDVPGVYLGGGFDR